MESAPERRRARRVSQDCHLRLLDASRRRMPLDVRLLDFSPDGLRVETEAYLLVGQALMLRVDLMSGELLTAWAQVRWAFRGGPRPTYGLAFEGMSEADRRRLDRFLSPPASAAAWDGLCAMAGAACLGVALAWVLTNI